MIAFVNLGSSANPDISTSANQTAYSNSSWTPPTDGLIVICVNSRKSGGPEFPTSITGNSLTWVEILTYNPFSIWGMAMFAADASGATTGATTITYPSSQSSCEASFFQVTGVDLSSGVAAAFVQTPTNTGTGTSGSVTLAAAGNSDNRPISSWLHDGDGAITERTNWTEFDGWNYSTGPARSAETQYRDDAFETTATATWTPTENWGGIAAELKAEVAAGAFSAWKNKTNIQLHLRR